MHRKRSALISFILVLTLAALAGCNMPGQGTPRPSEMEIIQTAAHQTVMAQLTLSSQLTRTPGTPGATAAAATPLPGAPLPTGQATVSPPPAAGTADPACDRARFEKDITVPDNSVLAPGATFVKTWRLQNAGNCTWSNAYSVVYSSGERFGAAESLPLNGPVAPGASVDVSIPMQAPATGGSYRGEWMLRNAAGQNFGTGTGGDKPFWVQIKVSGLSKDLFDLVSAASQAAWYSGVGQALPGTPLTFGGAMTNPNGAAAVLDGLRLETGATSGQVIATMPKQETDGFVYGVFPTYQVQAGDRLTARIGFATGSDNACSAGKVSFIIAYLEGSQIQELQEWRKGCDGSLLPVDIDLSGLEGRTLQFILAIRAGSELVSEIPIWNSVLITR